MSRRFAELPTPILEAIRVTGRRAIVDEGKPHVGSLLTEQLHQKISGRLKNIGRVVIAVNGYGEILEIGDSKEDLFLNLGVEAVSYLSFEEEPDDLAPILPDHEMSSSRPRRLIHPVLAVVDPSIVLDAFATTNPTEISSVGPCGDVFRLIADAEVIPVLTPQLQGELEDMVGRSRGRGAALNDGQQHGIETYLRRGELFQTSNDGLGADDHVIHRECERVLVRAARVSGQAEIVTPSNHLRRSAKKLGLKTQGSEEFLKTMAALQFAAQE